MLLHVLVQVGVLAATPFAVQADDRYPDLNECGIATGQGGPSLLQVTTVRSKVTQVHDHSEWDQAASSPSRPHLFKSMLEVGTVIALAVLLGAGLYLWFEHQLDEEGNSTISTMVRPLPRMVAWGADFRTQTTLTMPVLRGAISLAIENRTGFTAGQKVSIEEGTPRREVRTITGLEEPFFTLEKPCEFDHPAGAEITAEVQNDDCDYVFVFSGTSQKLKRSQNTSNSVTSSQSTMWKSFKDSARPIAGTLHISGPNEHRNVAGFELAKRVFMESHRHHFLESEEELQELFWDGMAFEVYRDACCELLKDMLKSTEFGFNVVEFTNAEGDRVFWRIEMEKDAAAQYAAHYRYPVSLNDDAYKKADQRVPENWNGDPVYAYFPYVPKFDGLYKPLTQIDRLKLMRMRLERYVNLDALLEQHVLLQHYANHNLDEISTLVSSWASISRWYRFPPFERIDEVKEYFGEQVAFLFLWQRYYLSALLVPAVVGGAVFFRRFCLPDHAHSKVQMAFTVVMSLWATIFNARYARFEERTRQRWGMADFRSGSLDLQPGYDPELQGTWRLFFLYGFGDFCAFLMMALTVFGTHCIQWLRSNHQDFFGIGQEWYVDKGSSMLTAVMILILDGTWQIMSYAVVNQENHRLRSSWWESWIKRMLTVRFFTNLYPFFYVGFVKQKINPDGCPKRDGRPNCLDELESNLFVFFCLSVFCNIFRDIGLIVYARLLHLWEFHGASKGVYTEDPDNPQEKVYTEDPKYMSLLVQATLYDYNDWVFIDDWTRQVTSFLLLTCFNVVLPVIGVFVLLTTMFEARLLAHRICCHLQRPFPRGAQGIGTWQSVLEVMTLAGVLMTVSFAIFVMEPLSKWEPWDQFIAFIAAEHAMLILNLFVKTKFPQVPPDVHEAMEENEKMLMQNVVDPTLHEIKVTNATASLAPNSLSKMGAKFQHVAQAKIEQNRRARAASGDSSPTGSPSAVQSAFVGRLDSRAFNGGSPTGEANRRQEIRIRSDESGDEFDASARSSFD